jgi:S1-C subfamily serine protease
MIKRNDMQNDKCAQNTLGPWLILVSVLILVTIVLTFYFADDIRRSQAARGQMQIGGVNVPFQPRQGQGLGQGQGRGRAATSNVQPAAFVPPWRSKQNPDAITGATPKIMSFNQAIGVVSPSLVGIDTSGGQRQSASGVIVNRRGYVLTNNHVVKGAEKITVTLNYDQLTRSYSAQVFDSRADLDLAVLKIHQTGKEVFSPAPLGNSDRIYIGQEIVAIGSPFGLSQSASSGIVSNANRTLTTGNRAFDGLIQTDASINPGSSGGALINMQGELIGLNTAIYSTTQAFSGISFAVPINQAKDAFPDLIETVPSPLAGTNPQPAQANRNQPRLNRNQPQATAPVGMDFRMMAAKTQTRPKCWLGISSYPVDSVMATQLDLPTNHGVLVNRVLSNSPAAQAGLMRGDMIFRFDNRRVRDENMLWRHLQGKNTGDKVEIVVFRRGKKKTLTTALQSELSSTGPSLTMAPQTAPALSGSLPSPRMQDAAGKKFIEGHWLGLEVIPLTAELATEYQIPKGQTGVLVDEVTLEAAESGILAGDMVQTIGNFPTPDLETFFMATQRVRDKERAQVGISRRGRKLTFAMTARNTEMLGFAQMEAAQPILPGALRPHRYMGACTDCHIFMKTGGQLPTDAGDIPPKPPPIRAGAKAIHRYRGSCATCHTIR